MAFRAYTIAAVVTLCIFAGLLVSSLLDDGSGKTSRNGVTSVPSPAGSGRGESRAGNRRDGLERGRRDGPSVEQGLPSGDAELVVVVLDNSGQAIPGIVVVLRWTRPSVGSLGVETTGDGKAVFGNIGAGSFALRIRRDGETDLETVHDISVGPGERAVVELRVGDFDLSILGRIVTTDGEPLPGITLEARVTTFGGDQPTLVPVGRGVLRATTAADGLYQITGLDENEYDVSTIETAQFPSAHRIVRAGLDSADFVLEATKVLRIVGTVTHAAREEPIAGVLVVPISFQSRQVKTEGDGRFEMTVPLRSAPVIYSVEFRLEGYITARRTLRIDEINELVEWKIDATLQEIRSPTALTGVLVGDDGEALRGETVHVHSATGRVRKKGVSDGSGRFAVRGLLPGDDYRVWVYPSGAYRDLRRNGILVPEEGLDLELTFESVGSGSIAGRVVNPEGNPVRNFRLWVTSASAVNKSRRLWTGPRGKFRVEDVPAGALTFQTRSLPRFTVRGLSLEEGTEAETEILLDWGDGEIVSRVVDGSGKSIELARVDLHWQQDWGDGSTTSYRSTQTDREGLFRFTRLGQGAHRLRINARGYVGLQLDVDVGSEGPPETVVLENIE